MRGAEPGRSSGPISRCESVECAGKTRFAIAIAAGGCFDLRERFVPPASRFFPTMPTLLVVDDDPIICDVLCRWLKLVGYATIAAQDGVQAIERYRPEEVDGGLLDIQMPRLSGIDVCRELRARAAHVGRDLPVWMITGDRNPDLSRRAIAAGAATVIYKPFSFDHVREELTKRLGPVHRVDSAAPFAATPGAGKA